LPDQAYPAAGSASFQVQTFDSATPMPCSQATASGSATASKSEGTSTRSEGNSTANPMSSMNRAAASNVPSRGDGSQRAPRDLASIKSSVDVTPGSLIWACHGPILYRMCVTHLYCSLTEQ
jgi:hypothetical protein